MRINRIRNGRAVVSAARGTHVGDHVAESQRRRWEELAARISSVDCGVLIVGETGSGKGFAARWIHERSSRASRTFVPVNCGAIPEAIIDSQLFGHARGAFSGADREHDGMIRAADGGTLLLDEIADLPLSSQARLLRLLEEREVQPVGYSKPMKVNVRVLAATSADLRERVQQGLFREDLFYRLDVVRLHVPPLRERRDEIEHLFVRFNRDFAAMHHQPALQVNADAMRTIVSYDWPGNVRELRTMIERLHVLLGGEHARCITSADLQEVCGIRCVKACSHALLTPTSARMAELKLEAVNHALISSDGSMTQAASMLGVHRSTLYRWLQMHAPSTA